MGGRACGPSSPAAAELSFRHALVEFAYPPITLRLHRTCLPSPAPHAAVGCELDSQIKYDGYRMMARRDPIAIRLITRIGHDWANRFPVIEAVNQPEGPVLFDRRRSGVGLAIFPVLRRRQNEASAFLFAFTCSS
jgi:hypothetical protein